MPRRAAIMECGGVSYGKCTLVSTVTSVVCLGLVLYCVNATPSWGGGVFVYFPIVGGFVSGLLSLVCCFNDCYVKAPSAPASAFRKFDDDFEPDDKKLTEPNADV